MNFFILRKSGFLLFTFLCFGKCANFKNSDAILHITARTYTFECFFENFDSIKMNFGGISVQVI